MFNTTLTDEYLRVVDAFDLNRATVESLVLNGVRASLLPDGERAKMATKFEKEFELMP
jgi:adenosine deaminase